MTAEFYTALLLLALLVAWLWQEAVRHERRLSALTLRVHVNGTRGKSSVTRLIAAGLAAGGRRVAAKTTGTEPKVLWPDGVEQRLPRRGPANIREIIGVVDQAVSRGADTLVAECMAVRPELQWFAEQRLVKAHIGVITNIRADHEDVLGHGLDNVAAALANTIPRRGVLVTTPAARELLLALPGLARTEIVAVSGERLPPEYLQGFPYEVIADNLALALKVCELAGVAAPTALAAMRGAAPDAGNLTVRELALGGRRVTLINALAANDPESTLWLWQRYVASQGGVDLVLLNCRADRRLRTVQLCAALATVHAGPYLLSGDIAFAGRQLARQGVDGQQVRVLRQPAVTAAWAEAFQGWREERLRIFAAGNVQGLDILINGEKQ